MKPPRRSTRSKKSHFLFSTTEWELEDEHWTSESKRLRKATKTAKKTCTQDVTAKPIDGRTEGQDLNKQEIRGADHTSDTEGRSHIISDVKSVGCPSSTDSHSIAEKSHSADGNCGNVSERNVIKEGNQLKITCITECTDMIVEKRKKAGGNGNIVKLKKAGKNKTDIDVNPNMETYKKMKRQNEDSNIINSEDILNQEFSVDICPSLEYEKLKQRQESEAFEGENGSHQTKRQCVPLAIQDSLGNSLEVNNVSLGPSTEDTSHLSNESQVLLGQMKIFGSGQINYEKDEFLNNQTIKEEILDDDVQIIKVIRGNPEFPLTPMISVKAEVESGESEMRSRAGNMGIGANDRENLSGIISDVSSAILSFANDMENSNVPKAIPSFEPHSTADFSFQSRQNVTVDRPRISVIMETPRGTISRDGSHRHDTIGMEMPGVTISRDGPHHHDIIGMETPRGTISRDGSHRRDAIEMDVSQHIIGMDHDYAKIAFDPPNVTGVGSASGRVDTPLTEESAEAREAVSSQEGAHLGVAREREHRAGLQVVGPSDGVDDQVVDGIDGSRSEGVTHSVENQAAAQGENSGASGYCGTCRGNDKMKIKMEIELSTAQFLEVAHVLPRLGSAANAV